jgi:hypothetical protein
MACGLIDHRLAIIDSFLDDEKPLAPLNDGRDSHSRPRIPAGFRFELVHELFTEVQIA